MLYLFTFARVIPTSGPFATSLVYFLFFWCYRTLPTNDGWFIDVASLEKNGKLYVI